MAKPNYSFEKRQRERAKKQKKEEKLLARKSSAGKSGEASDQPSGADAPVPDTQAPQSEGDAAA